MNNNYFIPNERLLRIYISGSMSNDPDFVNKFNKVASKIKNDNKRLIVINPAHTSNLFNLVRFSWTQYMHIALDVVPKCDIIYFLNDFRSSEGAMVEYFVAKKCNKICLFQNAREPKDFTSEALNDYLVKNFGVHLNKLYFGKSKTPPAVSSPVDTNFTDYNDFFNELIDFPDKANYENND